MRGALSILAGCIAFMLTFVIGARPSDLVTAGMLVGTLLTGTLTGIAFALMIAQPK